MQVAALMTQQGVSLARYSHAINRFTTVLGGCGITKAFLGLEQGGGLAVARKAVFYISLVWCDRDLLEYFL